MRIRIAYDEKSTEEWTYQAESLIRGHDDAGMRHRVLEEREGEAGLDPATYLETKRHPRSFWIHITQNKPWIVADLGPPS